MDVSTYCDEQAGQGTEYLEEATGASLLEFFGLWKQM